MYTRFLGWKAPVQSLTAVHAHVLYTLFLAGKCLCCRSPRRPAAPRRGHPPASLSACASSSSARHPAQLPPTHKPNHPITLPPPQTNGHRSSISISTVGVGALGWAGLSWGWNEEWEYDPILHHADTTHGGARRPLHCTCQGGVQGRLPRRLLLLRLVGRERVLLLPAPVTVWPPPVRYVILPLDCHCNSGVDRRY